MGDPLSIASGVAGLVSFGLQVCQGLMEYYDAWKGYEADVTALYNSVNNLVHILHHFEQRLKNPAHMDPDAVNTALDNITSCREGLMRLEAKLEKVKARGGSGTKDKLDRFSRRAMYPFKASTLAKLLEIVSELRDNLMSALGVLQLDNAMLTAQKLDDISSGIAVLQETTVKFHLTTAIRDWLKAPDPSSNYNMALRKRESTTGEWFVLSSDFTAWQHEPASVLWLHGGAGCGKTVLSSTIITATKLAAEKEGASAVLYYFFDFNDPAKQQSYSLLVSLVQQLALRDSQAQLVLEHLYDALEGLHKPTHDRLLSTFQEMIRSSTLNHVYLIIDALDECDEVEMLMDHILNRIVGWRLPQIHLLTTSRKHREIQARFDALSVHPLPIENDVVDGDIRTFVTNQILRDHWWDKWNDNVRQEVTETLVQKANGMFRWAVCQLQEVRKSINVKMLKRLLSSLPRTLDDTYSRALENIDAEYINYAVRLFPWLCFSFRPTTLDEANEMLATKLGSHPGYDEDELLNDPYDMQQVCLSLLTINTEPVSEMNSSFSTTGNAGAIIRLAHYSVKEYLVSDRLRGSCRMFKVSEKEAHAMIAEVCIRFLLRFNQEDLWSLESVTHYPLAQYAASNWFRHLRQVVNTPESEGLHQLAMELLQPESTAYTSMLRIFDVDFAQLYSVERTKDPVSPLYFSCAAGLPSLAERLFRGNLRHIRRQNSEGAYGSALKAAICQHDLELVQTLLKNGVSVQEDGQIERPYKVTRIGPYTIIEPATSYGHSPLVVAAEEEDDAIISIILDHMKPSLTSPEDCWNALDVLVSRPDRVSQDTIQKMIQLLFRSQERILHNPSCDDAGAVKSIGSTRTGVSPIMTTSEIGKQSLERTEVYVYNPVHHLVLSTRYGNLNMLKALLAEGADVATRDFGYTILYEACKAGYSGCVESLLSAGADVHAINPEGDTNLRVNSAHEEDSRPDLQETALHITARNGCLDPKFVPRGGHLRSSYTWRIMKLLLDFGGDPDAPNINRQTAVSLWFLSVPSAMTWTRSVQESMDVAAEEELFATRDLPNTRKAFELQFRAVYVVKRAMRRRQRRAKTFEERHGKSATWTSKVWCS